MSSPLTLRRLICVLTGDRSREDCRRALGLATIAQLDRLIANATKAGAASIDHELAAQRPAEEGHGG